MLYALTYRLLVLWILAALALGAYTPNTDGFYFPDQTDYIRQSAKCGNDLILWPGNRRCYKEGEQGPCNIGRVLRFDRRFLKPFCADS